MLGCAGFGFGTREMGPKEGAVLPLALVKFHVHVTVVGSPVGCRHPRLYCDVSVLVPLTVVAVAESSVFGNVHSSRDPLISVPAALPLMAPLTLRMPCLVPMRSLPGLTSQIESGALVSGTEVFQPSGTRPS